MAGTDPTPSPQARPLDVYFDDRSPFAYIAAEVLPDFAERNGLALRWQPTDIMLLGNYSTGLPYSEVKTRYVAVDAMRTAEYHGLEIRMPKPHPVRSGTARRLALVAGGDPRFDRLHRALFRAAWRDQRDLSASDVLRDCIVQADGPADDWLEAASDDAGAAPECGRGSRGERTLRLPATVGMRRPRRQVTPAASGT
jgi:2-hydroxychromene-2-carboxylate isomerase